MLISRRFFFLAMISLYIFAIVLQSTIYVNGDISWLMKVSERMLAGGTYFNDFFEINSPFILYLYAVPIFVANYLSLPHSMIFQAYVFILSFLSIASSYYFIKKIFSLRDKGEAYLFTFALAFVLLVFPIYEFGQREHLLLLFSMPYLFLVVYRLQGNRIKPYLAACVGIFAALGFAIKPFFLFVPLLIEVYYIFFNRSFWSCIRPETLSVSLVFLIYSAAILVFHQNYLFIVLPVAIELYNTTYGVTYSKALFYDPNFFCGFAFLFYLIFYQDNPYKVLSNVLLLALTGFFLANLTQHNILYYHVLPAFSVSILMFALFFILSLTQTFKPKQAFFMGVTGSLCLCFLFLFERSSILVMLLFHPITFYGFFALMLCLTFYLAQKHKNILTVIISVTSILAICWVFSNLTQQTSFYPYQLFLTFLSLSLFIALYFLNQKKYYYIFLTLFGIALFAYPFSFLSMVYWRSVDFRARSENLVHFMHAHALDKPVYFFTLQNNLEYPAAEYAGAKSVSRLGCLGWLHNVLSLSLFSKKASPSASELASLRDFYVNMTIDDFNRHKPYLVFVDVNQHDLHSLLALNFLKFYLKYPPFQTIWKHYHYVTTIKNEPLYELQVYQRDNS